MVSGKVCLCDSTPGNFNIQLKVSVNPWHTLFSSSDTDSLQTNQMKQICDMMMFAAANTHNTLE